MKSILFSAPMIRVLQIGRKTMTRRVVKPQPVTDGKILCHDLEKGFGFFDEDREYACPYGRVGDKLWVREIITASMEGKIGEVHWIYNADGDTASHVLTEGEYYFNHRPAGQATPSIFMPRWASRFTLEITDVRCERVQEITEADAIAEGIERLFTEEECQTTVGLIGTKPEDHGWKNYMWHGRVGSRLADTWEYQYSSYSDPRESFSSLWESINASRGFGWESNPFVWVIGFRLEGK